MSTSKLLPPTAATRSQMSPSEKDSNSMTEEAFPGAQTSTPSDAMQMPEYFMLPSPTRSMKLMLRVLGSTTSTAVASRGAQYSRPSRPAQIPQYFWPPTQAPSIKLRVWLKGSVTNTFVAFHGAQYSRPSEPAQRPQYLKPPAVVINFCESQILSRMRPQPF